MSQPPDSTQHAASGGSAFWPDSQADGLAVIVVLVALVAMALHFIAGDVFVEGALWIGSGISWLFG